MRLDDLGLRKVGHVSIFKMAREYTRFKAGEERSGSS
jgi:hypothetical protein